MSTNMPSIGSVFLIIALWIYKIQAKIKSVSLWSIHKRIRYGHKGTWQSYKYCLRVYTGYSNLIHRYVSSITEYSSTTEPSICWPFYTVLDSRNTKSKTLWKRWKYICSGVVVYSHSGVIVITEGCGECWEFNWFQFNLFSIITKQNTSKHKQNTWWRPSRL